MKKKRGKVIKIVLVDDDAMIASMIEQILSKEQDFEVVAKFTSGLEFLKKLEHLTFDLLLMDVVMPDLDGVTTLGDLEKSRPKVATIFLSSRNEASLVVAAMNQGAKGFITKSDSLDEVAQAIRQVQRGEGFYFPSSFDRAKIIEIKTRQLSPDTSTFFDLTKTQKTVLQLLVKGNSAKEVASHLHVSPRTVEGHRAQIMKKLEVSNSSAMVTKAIQLGLVQI